MRSMKTAGLTQVMELRRRALRLYAMSRIEKKDADRIVAHCEMLMVIIEQMSEADEDPDFRPRLGGALHAQAVSSN